MSVRMVMINGSEIAIEQSQIPTRVRSSDRFIALRPRPDLFVLRPDWSKRLFGGLCAVGGAMLFFIGLMTLRVSVVGLVLAVPGALTSAFGLWLFGPSFDFRLNTGEWSIRSFGRTRKRPLSTILAVQSTEGGWLSNGRSRGISSSHGSRYFLYQLNLILNEPTEPRLFVYSYRDLNQILWTGGELADFLKVPLVMSDGVAARSGKQAMQDSTGE